jgi:hypothetical protein
VIRLNERRVNGSILRWHCPCCDKDGVLIRWHNGNMPEGGVCNRVKK